MNNLRWYIRLVLIFCLLFLVSMVEAQQEFDKYVNLFLGTAGDHGQVSPAATVPFGMVAVGPDSYPPQHAGYDYNETTTSGISINRLSGVGCEGSGGNISIRTKAYDKTIKRVSNTEIAHPGYYSVKFSDSTLVSLTSTERMVVERYHFKTGDSNSLYINFNSSFSRAAAQLKVVSDNCINGIIRGRNTCWSGYYQISFCLYSDKDFKYEKIDNGKYHLIFDNAKDVELRIAISSVSPEDATKELHSFDELSFMQLKAQAKQKWNDILSRIEVYGGTSDDRTIFYTSLYRACLSPQRVARKGEYYRATNGNMYLAENNDFYSSWSIWDTYRAKFTLLNLLVPERIKDISNSLLLLYKNGKSNWSTQYEPTPSVRTEHAEVVLLDFYNRGLKDIDFQSAYNEIKKEVDSLNPKSPDQEMEAIIDRWAMGKIARIVGNDSDEVKYRKYAEDSFEKVWKSEFMNIKPDFAKMGSNGLYQGSRWQYRWGAPFFLNEMEKWVDKKELLKQLTFFFDNNLYNQGNEPDIHVPYLFNKLGRHDLTQKIVNRILTDDKMVHLYGGSAEFKTPYKGRAFSNTPDGYMPEMDEDDGTMSAWYTFSAIGLYPLIIGSDEYELVSPLFDKIILHLNKKTTLEISTKRRKSLNQIARKVLLNGESINDFCIHHSELEQGGEITFLY